MKTLYTRLASAPALALFHRAPEYSAKRGTILLYHGFRETKEQYQPILERLADAGFLEIGIDGVGHGERRYPDFDERFPLPAPHLMNNGQLEARFLATVRATSQEIPAIIDSLYEQCWAVPEHIGIAGISFGGLVTYAAIVAGRRIQAAAPIVASPQWKLPWPDSPHLHYERFFPTALLSQTAGKDTNQPPEQVRTFHQRLAPYYAQAPQRLRHIDYPDATHDLSQTDQDQAWNAATAWFTTFFARAV